MPAGEVLLVGDGGREKMNDGALIEEMGLETWGSRVAVVRGRV